MKSDFIDSPCRSCIHDKYSVCHAYKCTKYKEWFKDKWRTVTSEIKQRAAELN